MIICSTLIKFLLSLIHVLFFLFQKTIYGANVVIFEGIMSFVNKDLLKVCYFYFSLEIHEG